MIVIMHYLEYLEITESAIYGPAVPWKVQWWRHNACRSKYGTLDLCVILKMLHTYVVHPWYCCD